MTLPKGTELWTLREALDAFCDHKVSVSYSKKTSSDQMKWYRNTLIKHLGADTPLDKISLADVMRLSDHFNLTKGYSASTVNYLNSFLKGSQEFANARGRMLSAAKAMGYRKVKQGRTRVMTQQEEQQCFLWLTQNNRSDIADLVKLYLNTGLRKTEALDLKWDDVDLATLRITIWETKVNKPRSVVMSDDVHAMVTRMYATRPTAGYASSFIFGHINEKRLYRVWHEMKKAIGLTNDKQFTIHMLRHTFCTRLLGSGVDIRTVQEAMGHSSMAVTQRYSHFIPARFDAVASALNNMNAGLGKAA